MQTLRQLLKPPHTMFRKEYDDVQKDDFGNMVSSYPAARVILIK